MVVNQKTSQHVLYRSNDRGLLLHRSPVKLDVFQSGNRSLVAPEDQNWAVMFILLRKCRIKNARRVQILPLGPACGFHYSQTAQPRQNSSALTRSYASYLQLMVQPSQIGAMIPSCILNAYFFPVKPAPLNVVSIRERRIKKMRLPNIFKYWNCVCRATNFGGGMSARNTSREYTTNSLFSV